MFRYEIDIYKNIDIRFIAFDMPTTLVSTPHLICVVVVVVGQVVPRDDVTSAHHDVTGYDVTRVTAADGVRTGELLATVVVMTTLLHLLL